MGAFPFVISFRAFAGLTRNPIGELRPLFSLSAPKQRAEGKGKERSMNIKYLVGGKDSGKTTTLNLLIEILLSPNGKFRGALVDTSDPSHRLWQLKKDRMVCIDGIAHGTPLRVAVITAGNNAKAIQDGWDYCTTSKFAQTRQVDIAFFAVRTKANSSSQNRLAQLVSAAGCASIPWKPFWSLVPWLRKRVNFECATVLARSL